MPCPTASPMSRLDVSARRVCWRASSDVTMNAVTTTQADTTHSRRSPTRATTKKATTPARRALKGLVAPPGCVRAEYTRSAASRFSSRASKAGHDEDRGGDGEQRLEQLASPTPQDQVDARPRSARPRKPTPTIRLTTNSNGPGSRATAPRQLVVDAVGGLGGEGPDAEEQGQQQQRREQPHGVGGAPDPSRERRFDDLDPGQRGMRHRRGGVAPTVGHGPIVS